MAYINWGAALLRYPHLSSKFFSISLFGSPFRDWNTRPVSSMGCPHPLGHSADGHAHLFSITLNVGIYSEPV